MPSLVTCGPAKSRLRGSPPVRTPAGATWSAPSIGGGAVQRRHPADRLRQLVVARESLAEAGEHETRAERLREEERVAGAGAALRPDTVGMHCPNHGESVLRLGVADGVSACQERAG